MSEATTSSAAPAADQRPAGAPSSARSGATSIPLRTASCARRAASSMAASWKRPRASSPRNSSAARSRPSRPRCASTAPSAPARGTPRRFTFAASLHAHARGRAIAKAATRIELSPKAGASAIHAPSCAITKSPGTAARSGIDAARALSRRTAARARASSPPTRSAARSRSRRRARMRWCSVDASVIDPPPWSPGSPPRRPRSRRLRGSPRRPRARGPTARRTGTR